MPSIYPALLLLIWLNNYLVNQRMVIQHLREGRRCCSKFYSTSSCPDFPVSPELECLNFSFRIQYEMENIFALGDKSILISRWHQGELFPHITSKSPSLWLINRVAILMISNGKNTFSWSCLVSRINQWSSYLGFCPLSLLFTLQCILYLKFGSPVTSYLPTAVFHVCHSASLHIRGLSCG